MNTPPRPCVPAGTAVLKTGDVACEDPQCPLRSAAVAPIVTEEHVVAVLIAYGPRTSAALVRATEEVARWVSGQVELAELNREPTRAMEAELRALRAQISPHFIYNVLAAIASFVRTDPDRERELLLEFADFSRYALRRGGDFRRSPTNSATSSDTWCWIKPGSVIDSPSRCGLRPRCMITDAKIDFHWFPLDDPGLISIPLAFFLRWLGTVTSKEVGDPNKYAEL
jgi:hypothetical protein